MFLWRNMANYREGSNGGSQNMFLWRNMANYPCYPILSGALTVGIVKMGKIWRYTP